MLTQSQLKTLREGNDLDFSYVSAEGGRFRVNVFRKETGIGAAFRAIPTQMPSMDQLALPPIVRKLCDYHQGMILVTGSTGTGKTTTLASMIDYLNSTRTLNIISLEDPIEFVHRSKSSQVIQRELGTHLPSFAEGVRAAMREDPDVILVGEMRDAETICHGDDGGGNRTSGARAPCTRPAPPRPSTASSMRCRPKSANRPRASSPRV